MNHCDMCDNGNHIVGIGTCRHCGRTGMDRVETPDKDEIYVDESGKSMGSMILIEGGRRTGKTYQARKQFVENHPLRDTFKKLDELISQPSIQWPYCDHLKICIDDIKKFIGFLPKDHDVIQ